MRLIKISAPVRYRERVIHTAFSAGVDSVSVHDVTRYTTSGDDERAAIGIETSTPIAKKFIDKLLAEDYFRGSGITFNTRQPRAVISGRDVREITYPMCEPATDLYHELWQFSHVTYGLIGRILVSACLLAHGLIESKILLIIGGLLFLPVLPMVMSISYGVIGGQGKLALQGAMAFVSATAVLFVGGVIVAAVSGPPIRFNDIGSLGTGVLISVGVGIAAQLAAIDDAGRREMIGLAAASQLGLIPVWLGMMTVFGIPAASDNNEVLTRVLSFGANFVVLVLAIMATQFASNAVGKIRGLRD
jgi:hypothetical protein